MVIGFTGTQRGLTDEQTTTLGRELSILKADELHHGDCVGADSQAATIAWNLGYQVVVHPPTDPLKRAFKLPATEIREARPYLSRNRDIVKECGLLVACPSGPEIQRSGTWATVRYARKVGRPIVVVWPDGTTTWEGE